MEGEVTGVTTSEGKGTEPAGGVAALERGLAVLEAFGHGKDVLSLAELAEVTGLYKSTILRLAASLLRRGYLHRLSDGRYRLGPSVFSLGRIYQRSFDLRETVVPVLDRLAARTGETASLFIRDADSDVCLHRRESPRPVRDASVSEGDRFPMDGSACSMVLSAFSGQPGPAYDDIRRQVLMLARPSKRLSGVAAFVCPVFGLGNKLVGALLLSGPESRFADDALPPLRSAVLEEAARLTQLLGGTFAYAIPAPA
jgi:DNA-binding IclR family transcriptional regulator